MNFNDEFYSRIKESPNNKTEVNNTINAVFVYLVSEACVEFIVYRTKVFKVDNINEKTHMLLMNEDCVYLNVKIYKDGTGICWKDSLASGIVVTKEIAVGFHEFYKDGMSLSKKEKHSAFKENKWKPMHKTY